MLGVSIKDIMFVYVSVVYVIINVIWNVKSKK